MLLSRHTPAPDDLKLILKSLPVGWEISAEIAKTLTSGAVYREEVLNFIDNSVRAYSEKYKKTIYSYYDRHGHPQSNRGLHHLS
ncbi:MAG: hypothetical protein WCK49_07060 [Myxococcaceae bacterium]